MNLFTASTDYERELLSAYPIVAGMDEVGRGALAGPVAVGVAVVDSSCTNPPQGLTDSKKLTPRRRENLVGPISSWVCASAVGYSSNEEIDQWGIIFALRLAGWRALADVQQQGWFPSVVILDGNHDWLSIAPPDLFTAETQTDEEEMQVTLEPSDQQRDDVHFPFIQPADKTLNVITRVKADLQCAVVAAASVIAKVHRDKTMSKLDDCGYDWVHNKGYSSPAHIRALKSLGACDYHRKSWKLPGV